MALSRKPLKRKPGSLKFTPLKQKSGMIKHRPVDPKHIADRKLEGEKLWQLFEEHWKLKPHVCQSCECRIPGENKSIYHDHLLEHGRERYAHLKFEIANLLLVCFDCHTKKTNGYPTEKHKEAIETAKTIFNIS
jgi:5-methylcytosine-specific restriction endonuclease McrA